jgi:hypothetical protein
LLLGLEKRDARGPMVLEKEIGFVVDLLTKELLILVVTVASDLLAV